jgi:hypothetical protein
MSDQSSYRTYLTNLLDSTLVSYPFHSKSDNELIQDAIERSHKSLEFGLFKLGRKDSKTVIINNFLPVETKFFPLYCLDNNSTSNNPNYTIKAASFCYPSYFLSSLIDKVEKARSTFDNQYFNSYYSLFKKMENYYGSTVLVTTAWSTVTDFTKHTYCVNILPAHNDESLLSDLLRRSFVKERTQFILEFIEKPYKFLNWYPVDKDVLNIEFEEFKPKFINELELVENYELPPVLNDNYYDRPSDSDLARDNFYALTDGLEGDYTPDTYDDYEY